MPPHQQRLTIAGTITDVFAHRFVIESKQRRTLADLGPKGLELFPISAGDEVTIEGEMKPSELKVARIAKKGGEPVDVEHKKPHEHQHHHHPDGDPSVALRAAKEAGFEPLGQPRRTPKHFEVLARSKKRCVELHIELDGYIRKEKPAHADDPKWGSELSAL